MASSVTRVTGAATATRTAKAAGKVEGAATATRTAKAAGKVEGVLTALGTAGVEGVARTRSSRRAAATGADDRQRLKAQTYKQ